MTVEERKQVCEIVVDQAKGRITVVDHVGTTSTAQSVALAQHAERVGADYIASISPYYHRHDERTVVEYFRALVQAVDIPVYVYNNPKASGVTLTPSFLRHLADVGVQGIKDSAFSYIEFAHFMLAMEDRPDFRFIVGTEGIALPAFMLGAKGCVSGLANVFPELMVKLWDTYKAGDYEAAVEVADAGDQGAQASAHPQFDQCCVLYRAPRTWNRRRCAQGSDPAGGRRQS